MSGRPTHAKIDLDALTFNFRSSRAFLGDGPELMAVVKADAYGHGSVECARQLEAAGADWLAVALPEEGFQLRAAGIEKPILCLGSFWPGQESAIIEKRITPVVFEADRAVSLNEAAKGLGLKTPIHIKIDTGMGRAGIRPERIPEFARLLATLEHLTVDGLLTHFSNADDLGDTPFTASQVASFNEARGLFASYGIVPRFSSMANSPGAVAHPDSRGNLVRLGGILYGLQGDVIPKGVSAPELRPVMSLLTQIATLKDVPEGEPLGYGKTFRTSRQSRIAVIPIGYHDGLPRSLSNKGAVLIRGRRAPIVGRVSMDWTIVDVTDIPEVSLYDEVVLIGSSGEESITAEDIAALSGTISYEITCGVSARVPRIYDSGE